MASNAGLNIQIGATVTALNNALNAAINGITNFSNTVNRLSPQSGAAAAGITNLANAVNSGAASFNYLSGSAINANSAINNTTNAVNGLSPVTGAAAAGITNLANAINTGNASFVSLSNTASQASANISGTSTSINNLSPITSAAAAGITNLANAIQNGQASFINLGNAATQANNSLQNTNSTAQRSGASFNAVILDYYSAAGALNRLSPATTAAALGITNLGAAFSNSRASIRSFYTGYASDIQGLTRNTQDVVNTFGRLPLATSATSVGITNLTRAVNSGNASLVGMSRTAQYAVQANARLATSTQSLVRPAANATGAIAGLNNIIRDAPFGVIGIGNNITQLIDAFGQLQRQTGSTGAALRTLAGSVFGPAGIFTLGLSAAISLWTVYSMRQSQAKSKAEEAAKAIKTTGQVIKEAAATLQQYNAEALGEIATLNRLFEIATDDVRSRKDRVAALKELKKQTNGYLDDLKLETLQTDAARKALDEYNASLFNSALIKAYQGQLEELAKVYAFNKDNADKARKALDEFDAAQIRQRKRIQNGQLTGRQIDEAQSKIMANEAARAKLVENTNGFINKQNQAYDEILNTGKKIADLQVKVNPFGKQDADTKSAGESISKVLEIMNAQLAASDAQFKNTGGALDFLAKDKIQILQSAFDKLVNLGLKPTSPELENIQKHINDLEGSIIGKQDLFGAQLFNFDGKSIITAEEQIISLRQQMESLKKLGVDPASNSFKELSKKYDSLTAKTSSSALFDTSSFRLVNGQLQAINTSLVNAATAQQRFNNTVSDLSDKYAASKLKLEAFLATINDSFQSLALDIAGSLGDAIAGAFMGNGFKGAIQSFAGIFGSYLQSLGKQLIAYSGILKGVQIAIKTFSPVAAAVAGAAALVAGSALKAYASKVPSFATGGVVTEPTLAMVGDNPGRKEAIIPSELWDKIGGGGFGIASIDFDYDKLRIRIDQSRRRGGY
ncbi:hypothetical protein [Chitinophaga pinensis]|uniref:Uncharacterized protein n=1 Tax=Chitinophaga pinensis (strain ATCC 43595 / DSM 2588 / LMG 13176 / NBRC 15968 / NCIMB 11800 / UQM 2034) TaxID=485918 RepID=A0A979G5V1_CHIPD|nr:hypothetical protein [Chitinophaga pinensis]ACU61362.1 hypothetical protein Cpin_3900 [Chitinophaga pinensis DSM 2588]